MLKEAAHESTTATELVMGYPQFLGWVDASGEGVRGDWLLGKYALEPTIWGLEWPKKLRSRLITPTKTGGDLDINYLEMAVKPLAWLVLEVIFGTKNFYKHVELFRNNTEAVSWTQRGAEKNPQQQDICSES